MNRNHAMEERSNELSQNIDNGGEKLKSDNWAKGLFSLKIVIAHVVKECLPEYAPFPVELIIDECIDSFTDASGKCNTEIARHLMTQRRSPVHDQPAQASTRQLDAAASQHRDTK